MSTYLIYVGALFDLAFAIGIIANVGDGGNEADIKLVEDLAKSYIKKPNCIVLLVISCESESRTLLLPASLH